MADLPQATLKSLDNIAIEQRGERGADGYRYPEFLLQKDGKPFILEVPGKDGAKSSFYAVAASMEGEKQKFTLLGYNDLIKWRENLWQTPNEFKNTGESVYRSNINHKEIPADQVKKIALKIMKNGSAVVVPDDQVMQDYWTYKPNNPNDDQNVDSYEADRIRLAHQGQTKKGNQELGRFPTDPEKGELRSVQTALVNTKGLDVSVGSVISKKDLQAHILNPEEYIRSPVMKKTNAATQPSAADSQAITKEVQEVHKVLRDLSKQGIGVEVPSAKMNLNDIKGEPRISFQRDPDQNAAAPELKRQKRADNGKEEPVTAENYQDKIKQAQIEKLEARINRLPEGGRAREILEEQIREIKGEKQPEKAKPDPVAEGTTRTVGDIADQHRKAQKEHGEQFNSDGTKDYEPEPPYKNSPDMQPFLDAFPEIMNQMAEDTRGQLEQRIKDNPNAPEADQIRAILSQYPKPVTPEDTQKFLEQASAALPDVALRLKEKIASGKIDEAIKELQPHIKPGDVQAAFSKAADKRFADPSLHLTPEQQEEMKKLLVEQYKDALRAVADGRPLEEVVENTGFDTRNSSINARDWGKPQIKRAEEAAQEMIKEANRCIQEEVERQKAERPKLPEKDRIEGISEIEQCLKGVGSPKVLQ
ncbi:MAG: hypothetical protein OEY94_07020 [Alphaproteobacteria bacterium]|nr:hypothetical protein [Alphaproteobacteria bacterium]